VRSVAVELDRYILARPPLVSFVAGVLIRNIWTKEPGQPPARGSLCSPLTILRFGANEVSENCASVDLELDRRTLAEVDTERREAKAAAASSEFVDQRHRQARTGGAERVADGDGAAVDVERLGVDAELVAGVDHLTGERLVDRSCRRPPAKKPKQVATVRINNDCEKLVN
jgi:hypothetical protein